MVFYITDRVKGHLAPSLLGNGHQRGGGGDKNIAAYNFEGIFGQLSYYLKRLSYI